MKKRRAAWLASAALSLCAAWLLLERSAGNESSNHRALEFLRARGLELPKTASEFGFVSDDQLRSIAYYIRFDLPTPDADVVLRRLWCTPTDADLSPDGQSKLRRAERSFTDADVSNARYCDTDGPFDGQYHLVAIVGRAPSGDTRFLLSFSD